MRLSSGTATRSGSLVYLKLKLLVNHWSTLLNLSMQGSKWALMQTPMTQSVVCLNVTSVSRDYFQGGEKKSRILCRTMFMIEEWSITLVKLYIHYHVENIFLWQNQISLSPFNLYLVCVLYYHLKRVEILPCYYYLSAKWWCIVSEGSISFQKNILHRIGGSQNVDYGVGCRNVWDPIRQSRYWTYGIRIGRFDVSHNVMHRWCKGKPMGPYK